MSSVFISGELLVFPIPRDVGDDARFRRSTPSPYASIRITKRLLDFIPAHPSPIDS
jgi:hypothetical protein